MLSYGILICSYEQYGFVQNAFYVNIIHHCVAFIVAFAVRIKFSFMLPCLQNHEKFLEDVLRLSELSENVVSDAHYNIDHIVIAKISLF